MKTTLAILSFFVVSAQAEPAEFFKGESTFTNVLRDAATGQALPQQTFKRTRYMARFQDEEKTFTFSFYKLVVGDQIPFCQVDADFTSPEDGGTIRHKWATRLFQVKEGRVFETNLSSVYTETKTGEGVRKQNFLNPQLPSDAYAMSSFKTNANGTFTTEMAYYNMNQQIGDTIIDSELITTEDAAIDLNAFVTVTPKAVKQFIIQFALSHQSAVRARGTPQYDSLDRARLQLWTSLNITDVQMLRPFPKPVARPIFRPPPNPYTFFGDDPRGRFR